MDVLTISNSILSASIKRYGAELTSLQTKDEHEYIWQGNPEYWSGQSPLLFPIIGALPDDSYQLDGKFYNMKSHGFARKKNWSIESIEADTAVLTLNADKETLQQYPFNFKLSVTYRLSGNKLTVGYKVENKDNSDMPFQIGGHPGFNCSILDYKLVFEKKENVRRLIKNKLLTGEEREFLSDEDTINLTHDLFDKDALIFRDIKSKQVSLQRRDNEGRKVKMMFKGFTHFGIWKKPHTDAPFICLEPWFGVDSTEGDSTDFTLKEGIIIFGPGKVFESEYTIVLE